MRARVFGRIDAPDLAFWCGDEHRSTSGDLFGDEPRSPLAFVHSMLRDLARLQGSTREKVSRFLYKRRLDTHCR